MPVRAGALTAVRRTSTNTTATIYELVVNTRVNRRGQNVPA